jgi:hypothetical protein
MAPKDWNFKLDLAFTLNSVMSLFGRNWMRACSIVCLTLAVSLPYPTHAEYLLNCRLMDPDNPNFKRWCLSEVEHRRYLVNQCRAKDHCTVRVQNFRSAYLKNVAISQNAPLESFGRGIGVAAANSLANGSVSMSSSSVSGVAAKAGGLVGDTLSAVGF